MRLARPVVLLACLTTCIFGCGGEGSPVGPGSSAVIQGVFTNEYFGLTLPIPDGWFVASEESEKAIRDAGTAAVVGDDATLKAAVEASKKTTFQLLTLSEFEMGAAVEFNPSLTLMAERVSHVPGIKSGKDFLFHAAKMLLQTQLPYKLMKEAYPTKLGDQEWYRADFVFDQALMSIEQSYFAAKHRDYVLVVILSAATKEQMVVLERIADSIKL